MTDAAGLPDGWWESAERIAGYAAHHHHGTNPYLTTQEKRDAALDGLIEHIHAHGWPEPGETFKPLFYAAANAVSRANHDRRLHVRHWSYWHPVPAERDALAEQVTDRIGVYQLLGALGRKERAAVLALAEVFKDRSAYQHSSTGRPTAMDDAADLLGVRRTVFSWQIKAARKKARALWVAPGDTPPPRVFSLHNGGNRHRYGTCAADERNRRKRRIAAASE